MCVRVSVCDICREIDIEREREREREREKERERNRGRKPCVRFTPK